MLYPPNTSREQALSWRIAKTPLWPWKLDPRQQTQTHPLPVHGPQAPLLIVLKASDPQADSGIAVDTCEEEKQYNGKIPWPKGKARLLLVTPVIDFLTPLARQAPPGSSSSRR